MTEAPKTDSDYSPAHAQEIDTAIGRLHGKKLVGADTADRLRLTQSLIGVLETGLKVGYEHFVEGRPEPYPGAAGRVMQQCRDLIAGSRETGLLP